MARSWILLVLAVLGCSGRTTSSSGETESGTTQGSPADSAASTTHATTTGTGRASVGGTTSTSVMPSDETGASTETGGFIANPDFGACRNDFCPSAVRVRASCIACSYFDQDCPAGEACKPTDVCAAETWSGPSCRPAPARATGQPGDPCTMEENAYSGVDTCGPESMCFDVDPMTLEGTCVAFCDASSAGSSCDDADQTCFDGNGGWAPLCLPQCSPLLGDCPEGQGCYPGTARDFVCIPQGVPLYNDLETLHPACPAGAFMTTQEVVGVCPDKGPCCASFCDLEAPECGSEATCSPFFVDLEGVEPELHDVGVCVQNSG